MTVHNEGAAQDLIIEVLDSCRTGGIEYFKWIRRLGTIEVCNRRVEEDDMGEPLPFEQCDTIASGWVRLGPKRTVEPATLTKRARFPSRVKNLKRVATDLQDIGLMAQKVTSQRIMDTVDKIPGLSSGDKMFVAVRLAMIALADKKCFMAYATATTEGAIDLARADHQGTLNPVQPV
jgi:hypothetical protein